MKANELRIGNLLRWSDDPKRLLKVSEIGFNNQKNKFVRFENGDGSIIEDDDCLLEPIPLTEEWLIRLGFKRINEDKSFEIQHIYFDLNIYLPGNYVGVVNGRDEISLNYNLKYVHQLQNLYFALTGEELTLQ